MKVPGNYLQWGVEGKFWETVQISMHLTPPCEHGRLHVSSLKLPATGRWRNVPGKVQISMHLTYPCRHGRLQVSSWKLPATGQWKSVPGKVQIPMQSHSKLWNMGEHMSVPGNFPQRGDGRQFQERLESRCKSHSLRYTGDTSQFQETSRNGAMEERSRKGSNRWIPPDSLDCGGFGCW